MTGRDQITVTLYDDADLLGRKIKLQGRCAFYLRKLIDCGERGFSTIELQAGLRVSDGILKLRKLGFSIESATEYHRGTYAGRHCRYILRSKVRLETAPEIMAQPIDGRAAA